MQNVVKERTKLFKSKGTFFPFHFLTSEEISPLLFRKTDNEDDTKRLEEVSF